MRGNATPGLGLVVYAGVRITFVNVESSLTDIGEIVESNGGYRGTRKVSKLRIRLGATRRIDEPRFRVVVETQRDTRN